MNCSRQELIQCIKITVQWSCWWIVAIIIVLAMASITFYVWYKVINNKRLMRRINRMKRNMSKAISLY